MRKYPILLFALVLLLGVSAVFAARAMDAPKDQVAFTERVIYGDPAAADGLTVALHEQYRNYLHWGQHAVLHGVQLHGPYGLYVRTRPLLEQQFWRSAQPQHLGRRLGQLRF